MRRILLWTLLTPFFLCILLPVALYIPVVQDWVCQAVVSVLNASSDDYEYEVGSVRLSYPLKLNVNDVTLRDRSDGHTMLRVGRIRTGLDNLPLRQSAILINELSIMDVEVAMDALTESLGVTGRLDDLTVRRVALNLDESTFYVNEIFLTQPDVHVCLGPSVPDSTDEDSSWTIGIDRVVVRQGQVALDMSDVSLQQAVLPDSVSPYLDYNHLRMSGLDLEAERISVSPVLIAAEVNFLRAREENCGLQINQLAAYARMQGDRVEVKDLDLQLADADYLRGDAVLDLGIAQDHPAGVAQIALALAIDSANLMRLAAPYLPQLSALSLDQQLSLTTDARMMGDTLDVRSLSLQIPACIDVQAKGFGTRLFDNEQRSATMTVNGALWHAEPLVTAFVASSSQRAFCVPDSLLLDIAATQRGRRLTAHLGMKQGHREVVGAEAEYDVETEAYQLTAQTHRLNVSEFVPSVLADGMTLHLQADGRHYDFNRRSTRLEAIAQVDTLYYLGQDGKRDSLMSTHLEASLLNGNYRAQVQSQHPTLQMLSTLEGCYRRDTLSVNGFLDLRHADLAHLPYLAQNPDLGRLTLYSRFDVGYNWHDFARIRFAIDTLIYDVDDEHEHFDDIIVSLDSRPDWLVADVQGGDASLSVKTDQSIAQLPAVADSVIAVLSHQLATYRPDFAAIRDQLPQMEVHVNMARQNPFSRTLERRLGISFDRFQLSLHNDRDLQLTGNVYNLLDAASSSSFDTIAIDLRPASLPRSYDYRLHAQHHDITPRNTYDIHGSGCLMRDSLTLGVQYVDGRNKIIYDALASLAMADDTATLHLERGPILLQQPFTVNPDNYVRLMQFCDMEHVKPTTKARLMMEGPRDLKLNLYTRKMPDSEVGNQLLFLIRNLDLGYAAQMMEWEESARGRMNLTAAVDIFPDSIDARLRSGIQKLQLGDYQADTLALVLNAQGAPRRRDINGTLSLDSIPKMQMQATLADSTNIHMQLSELPLPLLNVFMPQDIQLWGSASGSFNLLGRDFEHAQVAGGLVMQDAGAVITDMDARLHFSNDTIHLRRNRLLIRDYEILAANNNPIKVRGLVDMSKDVTNPAISLTVTGENVRLINNRKLEHKDQYICGRLPISPNIRVSGSLSKLAVTGRLSILSGTDLQYYMQDDPLEASSKVDHLVEFVRFDQIDHLIRTGRHRRRSAQTTADEGMTMELKIDMANDAKVTAHLAGTDNNRVDIVGGASLTLQCGADERMVMNGTYSMMGGKVDYKLPILPLVKTFGISNNSNLLWQDSDPGNPTIDIHATEEVRTTVNDDAGSRVVKFLVSINITGTLDALSLTFDCDAPEDGAISSDIASLDADERSKAALMLLVAQTYVGPGNSSSMGLGTANAALNSMLNREMDSMLSGMKHTNIDLGIDTYNTDAGNTRTNYSVKVSQNFFNDRFRATIGGQVSSGGDVGQSSGARLGDMSLEWLIKKDGSHLMKLFRTTNYESVLEGELIETGISYVQERSGFRLKQLFIPTSRKRQERLQQLIREMQTKEEQAEREARMQQMRQRQQSVQQIVIPQDSVPHHDTPSQ